MNSSRNVLITGASTGIGYATASKFIKEGFDVYGSLRKIEDAERMKSELGTGFHPLIFDVTDHQTVDQVAQELITSLKGPGLCCLINNAGIAINGPLLELPIDEVRRQFEVNLFGLLKVTQAFAPLLGACEDHPVKPGKIINISSVSGKIGFPLLGPYVASKHALEGLSKSLRRELMIYGIDVVTVGPGAVKTPIWDKALDQDHEKYRHSPYAIPMQKLAKIADKASQKGLPAEKIGELFFRIATASKTKTRYNPVARRFADWIIPQMLPPRVLDRMISKIMKLQIKKP